MNIYLNTTPITDKLATTAINIVIEQQIALLKKFGANVEVRCAHIWGTNCRLTLDPTSPADTLALRQQQRQSNLNITPEQVTNLWIYTFSLNTDDPFKREVLRVIEAVRTARHATPPPPTTINWDAIPLTKYGCVTLIILVLASLLLSV